MSFTSALHSKFRGLPLLATMEDESRCCRLKLYYIATPGLVGVKMVDYNDSCIDTWISPIKGCFHSLKEGLLESQLVLAASGQLSPESVSTPRHNPNIQTPRKIMRRPTSHA